MGMRHELDPGSCLMRLPLDALAATLPAMDMAIVPESIGPLAGLRVIELGGEHGQWAAKLLADMGADVIKVEPPDGCRERRTGPFAGETAEAAVEGAPFDVNRSPFEQLCLCTEAIDSSALAAARATRV